MINIVYLRDGQSHDLRICGHADYSVHGDDIVCAGVSAITYTLLGYLLNSGDAQDIQHQTESGDCFITCHGGEKAEVAFDMAVTGYLMVANTYPDNVTISMPRLEADSQEQTADITKGA